MIYLRKLSFLLLFFCAVAMMANEQKGVFLSGGIYYQFADKDSTSLMVVPTPADSAKYAGFVTVPSRAVITRAVTDAADWAKPLDLPVVKIAERAFAGSAITGIEMGDSIREIDINAFLSCNDLQKVIVRDLAAWYKIKFNSSYSNPLHSAHRLYSDEHTEITSIVIPDSVTAIGNYLFSGFSALTAVTIPSRVTTIGVAAFIDCKALSAVTIPDSVVRIDDLAFGFCEGMESVTIGAGVREIGGNAFANCNSLKKSQFASVADLCRIRFSNWYANPLAQTHQILVDGKEETTVEVPADVEEVSDYAFYNCSGITRVIISSDNTRKIGTDAFYGCKNIYSVSYPSLSSLQTIEYGDGVSNPMAFAQIFSVKGQDMSELVLAGDVNPSAYKGAKWLTSVTLKSGVTRIGKEAFRNCTKLQTVIIDGAELRTIDADAFNGCGALKEINLPASVDTIGLAAFRNCGNLTEITIPEGVKVLGNELFVNCGGLEEADIRQTFRNFIPDRMFKDCSKLKRVVLSDAVEVIGNGSFSGCTSLTALPEGGRLKEIRENAFAGCKGLTKLELPKTITVIDQNAFANCEGLTEIIFPDSLGVNSILSNAFVDCMNIRYIYSYQKEAPHAKSNSFDYDARIVLFYPAGGQGYDVAPWNTSIFTLMNFDYRQVCYYVDNKLYHCDSVLVGQPIPAIDEPQLEGWTFSGWDKAVPQTMPGNNVYLSGYFTSRRHIDGVTYFIERRQQDAQVVADFDTYNAEKKSTLVVPDSIMVDSVKYRVNAVADTAFARLQRLQTVKLPESLRRLGRGAFASSGLISFKMPASIDEVADSLFYGCSDLVSVQLTSNVKSIGVSAFNKCTSLTMQQVPLRVQTIGDLAFCNCESITKIDLPASLTSMGERVFLHCSRLKEVRYYQGFQIAELPAYTFQECSQMEKPALAPSMLMIGKGAFMGCTGIRQLTLDDGVRSIGTGAFSGCTGLQNLTLPASVELLGKEAFGGCNNIQQITIHRTEPPSASLNTFSESLYRSAQTNLYVPNDSIYRATTPWDNFSNIYTTKYYPLTYLVNNADTVLRRDSVLVGEPVSTFVLPDSLLARYGHRVFSGWSGEPPVMPADSVTVTGCFQYRLLYQDAETGDSIFCQNLFCGETVKEPSIELARQGFAYALLDTLHTMLAKDDTIRVSYTMTEAEVEIDGLRYYVYTQGDNRHAELMPGIRPYTKASITVPDSIEYLTGKYAVTVVRTDAMKACYLLKTVSLPPTIRKIGTQAFRNCGHLTSVAVPASVESMGEEVFMACGELSEVSFATGSAVKKLPAYTFQDCAALATVDLPNTLDSIDHYAFRGCARLTSMVLPAGLIYIGDRAFDGCTKMKEIKIANEDMLPDAVETTFDEKNYDEARLYVSAKLQDNLKAPWDKFRFVELGDTVDVKQCAKPVIDYIKGKLRFTCATEGAKIISEVKVADAAAVHVDSIKNLNQTYVITAYATATGFKRSDATTASIVWRNGTPTMTGFGKIEPQDGDSQTETGMKGDMNGDNQLTAEDAALILKELVRRNEEQKEE